LSPRQTGWLALRSWWKTFRFAQNSANLVLSKLFEPPCAACGAILTHPLGGAVCPLCWAAIHRITPPVCDRCGDPLPSLLASLASGETCRHCDGSQHAVDRSRAIGPYEGRLRDIIHALKYDGRRSIAPGLGAMMREAGTGILDAADCAVPVPLHYWRQHSRGFNQADDLACQLGLPVVRLLKRTVATRPQIDLPASERARNVRDAFALSRRAPSLCGLVIVLVDDVATTGATLEACASILKAAGAASVRALTAARVVSGRP
jgi:ComF family protein